MKSKQYLQRLISISFAVVLIHLITVYFQLFSVSFLSIVKLDIIVLLLFIGGGKLIAGGFAKGPDVFVNKFLILTTFQLLAIMTILMAMIYVKLPDFRGVAFHTISIFIILLGVQSILLIETLNRKK